MERKSKYCKELKLEIVKRESLGEKAFNHLNQSLIALPLFHSDRGFQYTSKQFKFKRHDPKINLEIMPILIYYL